MATRAAEVFETGNPAATAARAATLEEATEARLGTSEGDSLQQRGIMELSSRTAARGSGVDDRGEGPGGRLDWPPRVTVHPAADSLMQNTSEAATRERPHPSLQ